MPAPSVGSPAADRRPAPRRRGRGGRAPPRARLSRVVGTDLGTTARAARGTSRPPVIPPRATSLPSRPRRAARTRTRRGMPIRAPPASSRTSGRRVDPARPTVRDRPGALVLGKPRVTGHLERHPSVDRVERRESAAGTSITRNQSPSNSLKPASLIRATRSSSGWSSGRCRTSIRSRPVDLEEEPPARGLRDRPPRTPPAPSPRAALAAALDLLQAIGRVSGRTAVGLEQHPVSRPPPPGGVRDGRRAGASPTRVVAARRTPASAPHLVVEPWEDAERLVVVDEPQAPRSLGVPARKNAAAFGSRQVVAERRETEAVPTIDRLLRRPERTIESPRSRVGGRSRIIRRRQPSATVCVEHSTTVTQAHRAGPPGWSPEG